MRFYTIGLIFAVAVRALTTDWNTNEDKDTLSTTVLASLQTYEHGLESDHETVDSESAMSSWLERHPDPKVD